MHQMSFLLPVLGREGAGVAVSLAALMAAASRGHADIVRVLLAKGAKTDARDKQGDTAYGLALLSTTPEREAVLHALPSSGP